MKKDLVVDSIILQGAIDVVSSRLSNFLKCPGQCDQSSLIGCNNQLKELKDLLQHLVKTKSSNSVLIIGPRGGGKSMLLRKAMEEINVEIGRLSESLVRVRLNGLVETDDKIAVKEIARQLAVEHIVSNRTFNSYGENLLFLLNTYLKENPSAQSVVFVLEEFDLFTQHKHQTLLYNLFDICHSSAAPICVVGMTTRLDVLELLEKRVKSRFSHRQIYLLPTYSFDSYLEIFKSFLKLPASFDNEKFSNIWNKHIDNLANENVVQDVLMRQFRLTKDIRSLQTLMVLPFSRLSVDRPFLEGGDFIDAARLRNSDSKSFILLGLSMLELCLVIAACHLTETYGGEPFNYEMVFKEYVKFCQRRSAVPCFDRVVTLQAFDHLCNLELLLPADGVSQRVQREYQLVCLQVDRVHILGALQRYPNCPTDIKHWAQSAIN